jgi:pentatricopeptide repeat protein
MYAKCGKLVMAQSVFDGLHVRNVVSWSSLIGGYAQHGKSFEALECFERMQSEGLYPNSVTFVCILSACCRIGLWDGSNSFFESMTRNYGISPNEEHHNCIVSFLGFTGHFDKAVSLIEMMPSCDYDALWLALLAACRKWGNMELASLAFDRAERLKNGCSSASVLKADDYADLGTQRKEERIEPLNLKLTALEKQVKCGFFNIRREDANHSQSKHVCEHMDAITLEMSRMQNSTCNGESVVGEQRNYTRHDELISMTYNHPVLSYGSLVQVNRKLILN